MHSAKHRHYVIESDSDRSRRAAAAFEMKNSFRKGRSTTPQILALRRLIEELKISNKQAYIVFVDFSKAFDSVNRKTMLHILLNYGIREEIVNAISIIYDNPLYKPWMVQPMSFSPLLESCQLTHWPPTFL